MNREKFQQQPWSAASSGCWELRWPFRGENPSAAKKRADALCREESLWQSLKLGFQLAKRAAEGQMRLLQAPEGALGSLRSGAGSAHPSALCHFAAAKCHLCHRLRAHPVPDNGTEHTGCRPRPLDWYLSLLFCSGFSPSPWGEVADRYPRGGEI